MVSIAAQDPTGNALDPLAQTVVGSYLDDSFWRLSAIPGGFGRALQSMLVPVVIEEYPDDKDLEYNIDMHLLHKIKEPLLDLNAMIGMQNLKENIVDQLLFYIQNLQYQIKP